MRKKTVVAGILVLLLLVILLGMVRYWMAEQRQMPPERGTLVKVCEDMKRREPDEYRCLYEI